MLKFGIAIILIYANTSFGSWAKCSLRFPDRLAVVPGMVPNLEDAVVASDCPAQVQERARELLSSLQGRPSALYLSNALSSETGVQVEVHPAQVELVSLKDLAQLAIGKDKIIKTLSLANGKSSVRIPGNADLSVLCRQCPANGEALIEVSNSGMGQYWLKATHVSRAKVLVAKRSISNVMEALSQDDFEEKEMEVQDATDLFQERSALKFHRAARPLAPGSTLKASDVVSTYAVVPGVPVELIYSSSGMRLTSRGTALSSARVGDRVGIRPSAGGKAITGKVVDFNKVDLAL